MKYKITYLLGNLDTTVCPPAIVKAIFPAFNGEPVTLTEQECTVEFSEPQIPVNLSPLIVVTELSTDTVVTPVEPTLEPIVEPTPVEPIAEEPKGIISTIWGTVTNIFTTKE